jgi:general secretion pathway protein K
MMWQNHLWLRQVENLDAQAQARWSARAAINWGRAVLEEDKRDVDHNGEQWAVQPPPFEAEGGELVGSMRDAQGLFNLNNLVRNGKVSQGDVVVLTRLMIQLNIDPNLINALLDWIDGDSEVSHPGGAEDMHYLALDPAYRAANRALSDINDLYRVRGFGQDSIERLRPFVAALPQPTTINVNTAPAEVLAALCAGLQLTDAKALVEQRAKAHFKERAEFRKHLADGIQLREEDYNINSQFFIATTRVRQERVRTGYQALLERPAEGRTRIVWLKQIEE